MQALVSKFDAHQALMRQRHADIVRSVVKVGDVLTHSGCMGCLFEHEFSSWDGAWMRGVPTRDTYRFDGKEGGRRAHHNQAADIAPASVTHINRVPVEAVEFLADRTAVCLDIKEQANG
ncbi:hypothetical protein [Rugamonas sp. DEMB1]|uniref:hypothetical protein n=1 Tax=Rugamonas sp. DEMB1 TaxID=3039386 RepID=UPI00244CCCA1|nr:hypothetical protein [Rugamonas sp. DEMB1]WGG51790.1 hypothetical protein QC826_06105 [Rugamonas sp. DEMB1]